MRKEQLAENYAEQNNSAYTNDYYGYLAGWAGKEKQIKDVILQQIEKLTTDRREMINIIWEEPTEFNAQTTILRNLLQRLELDKI